MGNGQLITVVIPTYNRQDLIVDALNSCLNQSHRPLEIIVVDDGSEDETELIINNWLKSSHFNQITFRLIKQKNLGGNAARNNGIKLSEGDFIAFLDSDDTWNPNKLELQLNLINRNKSIGGVYCGYREVDIESKKIISDLNRVFPNGKLLSKLLVKDVTCPTSTFLVRKSVFHKVGYFDEQLQARQDWDMWIRLSEKYLIEVVPHNLIDLRHHSGIRTASNPHKEISAYKTIMEKYEHLLKKEAISVQKEAKANYLKRMGRIYFHHNLSKRKAINYYIKSILIYPKDFDNWAALVGFFLPKFIRQKINSLWNKVFSKTKLRIRSH